MQLGWFLGVTPQVQFWADCLSWGGILIPIALVFVTAIIRSLVKHNNFLSGENLYLGIDLCFAGVATASVEVLDSLREHLLGSDETQFQKVLLGLLLTFCSAVALLAVTKVHQKWDYLPPKTTVIGKVKAERHQLLLDQRHRKMRIIWLGVASNGAGFATIAVFAWLRARKLV